MRKLDGCEFDVIFDVRSHSYYENWRLAGGEHLPDATQFDPERLATQNITSVAFYCWNDPWESEPAAQWFAQQYGSQGVQVYDIKGLSYLDDVPGMCQYIDGDDAAIAQHSPHCASEGGVGRRTGANRCNYEEPTPEADDDTIVLDPYVMMAVVLCAVGIVAMLIVAFCVCGRGRETATPGVEGKLDDPWATPTKVVDDYDDCEMCKAGLTGLVPSTPVLAATAAGTYPENLPGTPDSNEGEVDTGVGAHGLSVTRWVSTDDEDEEQQQEEQGEQADTVTREEARQEPDAAAVGNASP